MNMTRYMLLVAVVAMSLSGCETMSEPAQSTLAPDFGDAVKANMAVQVVNPEAGKEEQPAPPLEGQRAERALEDYRKEKGEVPRGKLLIDIGS